MQIKCRPKILQNVEPVKRKRFRVENFTELKKNYRKVGL